MEDLEFRASQNKDLFLKKTKKQIVGGERSREYERRRIGKEEEGETERK